MKRLKSKIIGLKITNLKVELIKMQRIYSHNKNTNKEENK
jgi:hypothetical protein